MRKKICYITTVSGTLESFVLPIVKYISEETDWDIYVICNYSKEFECLLPKNIHYYPVAMSRGINLDALRVIKELVVFFREEKFDLVQYSTPNASFYAAIAAKIANIPVRLYCQWGIAYVGFSGIKAKIFKCVEKIVCGLSTCIEPDSRGNLYFSDSEGLYKLNKGRVIWNGSASGIDVKKFDVSKKVEWRDRIRYKLGIKENEFVFGFVGRITRDKGINELLQAYKAVLESSPDTYLLLVGSVEKEDMLDAELYRWAKEEKHVIFGGKSSEVEKYLAAMDVFVLPSYREGFGSAVIEAEAMGLPVIVTNIPGPTDAMRENETGLIVEKKNSMDLQEKMKYLYLNQELCSLYGHAAIEFAVGGFEQRKFAEKVIEDRKKLLNEL